MPHTHDSKPWAFHRGPFTVRCESLFWHPQRYPRHAVAPRRPPLTETARPRELEQPFRLGQGRVFRVPLTRRALVVGYWGTAGAPVLSEEESERLLEAVEGAHIPDVTATEIADWAPARDVVRWWQQLRDRLEQWLKNRRPSTGQRDHLVIYDEVQRWPESVPWTGVPDSDPVLDLEFARHDRIEGP